MKASKEAGTFYQSLRFKITLGVVAPAMILLVLFSYVRYFRHREIYMRNLELSAINASEVIERSLQHAMLTQDLSEVQQIVNEIAKQEGVQGLFLLSKEGEVRISPVSELVGTRLDISDRTCQTCHRQVPQDRPRGLVFAASGGRRVFRSLNPIENRPECHQCHNPKDKLTGVLITDFDMALIDAYIAEDLHNDVLWSAAALAAVILTRLYANKCESGGGLKGTRWPR